MSVIPDPERPQRVAIGEDGALLSGVFIRRLDSPEAPVASDLLGDDWEHVGWSEGIETHESPSQPEG